MGFIDVEVSDAGDLSPRLGVEALLCDVKGVECILFISLMDALGRTSSLNVVSMARVGYLWRPLGHETRRDSRRYLTDLCAKGSHRPWF